MEPNDSIFEYHDLIEAIVTALEMRDYHTQHHSQRVSNMVEAICLHLNLSEKETRLYHIAADLHDIGKIGVWDAVLLKSGTLNENEWQEMQSHAIIGGYILGKVERFGTIAHIVRHHHEHWDGKGYPDAMCGEQIPFGARVIAVADSMDAMLSDRSYRRALPLEICHSEIEKNSAVMYDRCVVKTVLACWDDVITARGLTIHSCPRDTADPYKYIHK